MDKKLEIAQQDMLLKNIYNTIKWDKSDLNRWWFDQNTKTVEYNAKYTDYKAICKPEILGTFNNSDNTFLWADKNPSVQEYLSENVHLFRQEQPVEFQADKFETNYQFCRDLLALFNHHTNGLGGDDKRYNNDLVIFFIYREIDVYENDTFIENISQIEQLQFVEKQAFRDFVATFLKAKAKINHAYYDLEKISSDEAFKAMKELYQQHWLNDNFSTSLSSNEEEFTIDYVVEFTDSKRFFVVYTINDLGHMLEIGTDTSDEMKILGAYFLDL